ncbi:MAG: lipopolysaccharide biosynthesis protein [Prevotella sp.]|nr:lipopolysaccharide biosynthesis protein [Prevotella sp.]
MSETLKEKTAKGLFWGGLNSTVQQLLGIVFGIILARRLDQSDFGMIAMISIFSLIGNDLQNSGFKVALANLRQPTSRDYNSVFWFNILMGGAIYVILFLSAPFIARFYHVPELTSLSRYAFLGIVFASFGTSQSAWLFKNLHAKQQAKAGMIAVLLSSSVAVIMAYMGFAYWALATQTNLYILTCTLLYWHYSPWRPTLKIDLGPAKRMFRFSVKLLISQVLTDVNNNILNILIGRFYGKHDTGNYNQAFQWSTKGSNIIQNMVQQVAQPVLVSVDDEHERQLRVLRKMMRFAAFISFPLLFGLSLVSHEFIVTLLGEKWAESARYLRLLAVASAFLPLSTLLANVVITKGRSNIFMYCNLSLACLQTLTMLAIYYLHPSLSPLLSQLPATFSLLFSLNSPLYMMVLAFATLTILWFFVWGYFARRLAGYRFSMILADTIPFAATAAIIMIVTGHLTSWLLPTAQTGFGEGLLLLIARIVIAAALYYIVMRLAHVQILNECLSFLKKGKKGKE